MLLINGSIPALKESEHDLKCCLGALTCEVAADVQGGELKASIAFPALALFDLFRTPIRLIPDSINMLISANIAMKRIQAYLDVRSLSPCSFHFAHRGLRRLQCGCISGSILTLRHAVQSWSFYHAWFMTCLPASYVVGSKGLHPLQSATQYSFALDQLDDVKQPPQLPAAEADGPAIVVRDATFAWDGEGKDGDQSAPTLHDIDLQVSEACACRAAHGTVIHCWPPICWQLPAEEPARIR